MENLCGGCKRCCIGTYVRVSEKDLLRWQDEQRYDILLCLERWPGGGVFLMHKKGGEECIFLGKDGCDIYGTRPKVCRDFPKGKIHLEQFGCKIDPITKKLLKREQSTK